MRRYRDDVRAFACQACQGLQSVKLTPYDLAEKDTVQVKLYPDYVLAHMPSECMQVEASAADCMDDGRGNAQVIYPSGSLLLQIDCS